MYHHGGILLLRESSQKYLSLVNVVCIGYFFQIMMWQKEIIKIYDKKCVIIWTFVWFVFVSLKNERVICKILLFL